MVVVVEIAEPVNVPVSVKLPMVDAAGRKLSASVTLPEPLPTSDAEIVQAVAGRFRNGAGVKDGDRTREILVNRLIELENLPVRCFIRVVLPVVRIRRGRTAREPQAKRQNCNDAKYG